MPTIRANGLELAYRIDGDGAETLVLVNGLADAKESWELQLPALSERYRVISFDNRGIGESPTPPGPYTTADMAEDVAGLVDALGVGSFHLLGVSMGGMIAQEYAIAHADRLLSATFACTYSYPGPFCLRMFQCWRDLVPTLGVGFTQREVILWAFTTDFFEQREDELAAFEAEMASNPQTIEAYLAQLHAIERHDTRGRLAAVTCPSLTLIGEGDLIVYPKLSRRLHDELPRSTWAEVAGGHGCLWEYPDAFNTAVLSYLAGVEGRPRGSRSPTGC
jgi:3-oxoadipate enol-lactonase